jgi:hypothetical protein
VCHTWGYYCNWPGTVYCTCTVPWTGSVCCEYCIWGWFWLYVPGAGVLTLEVEYFWIVVLQVDRPVKMESFFFRYQRKVTVNTKIQKKY